MIVTGRAELDRLTGIEIHRHHEQALGQLAEIIGAPRCAPHPLQIVVDRLVVEKPSRQRTPEQGQRLQQAQIQRIAQITPERLPEQPRHRRQPPGIFAQSRHQENLRIERMFLGLVVDEDMADLAGLELIGQQGRHHRARADANINVEPV